MQWAKTQLKNNARKYKMIVSEDKWTKLKKERKEISLELEKLKQELDQLKCSKKRTNNYIYS